MIGLSQLLCRFFWAQAHGSKLCGEIGLPIVFLAGLGLAVVVILSRRSIFPTSVSKARRFITPDTAVWGWKYVDIQGILERTGSPLKTMTYYEGIWPFGKSWRASEWIDHWAQVNNINPKWILITMQREQSALTPNPANLDWAMGYGKFETGEISSFKGFWKQIKAASTGSNWNAKHVVRARGLIGKKMVLYDGEVVPQNAATAYFYLYTPYARYAEDTFRIYKTMFPEEL